MCTSEYFLKCGPSHGHTLNGLTCVSTPIDVNAVLAGFFFDFMSFFSSLFCVCEDANVTHKVSIVKKKHCWVCLQYSFGICC